MQASNPHLNPASPPGRHSLLNQFLFRRHRDEPAPAWMVFPLIYAFVFLTHLPLLRLPYFWDEAGYYIPAAFDFFRTGSLIPYSTLSNAHPPLPAMYLAFWWKISGFTPVVTRQAICLIAAFALTGVFVLVRRSDKHTRRHRHHTADSAVPGVVHAKHVGAGGYLCCCRNDVGPGLRIVRIAVRAQRLDCGDMVFVAALSKETAIVMPLTLSAWHLWEIRRKPQAARGHARAAMQFAVSVLPLCAWYAYHFHGPDTCSAIRNLCATTRSGHCICFDSSWRWRNA